MVEDNNRIVVNGQNVYRSNGHIHNNKQTRLGEIEIIYAYKQTILINAIGYCDLFKYTRESRHSIDSFGCISSASQLQFEHRETEPH